MTEYTDPTTVDPGSAGTATVRGEANVRVMRLEGNWNFEWVSASFGGDMRFHNHSDITDLLLDVPAGEVPADSVVITAADLNAIAGTDATATVLRGYADALPDGCLFAFDLLRLLADKLDALPKPVPPRPEGLNVVAFVDEVFWSPNDDGSWTAVNSDRELSSWSVLVRAARKHDNRDPVVYRREGIS